MGRRALTGRGRSCRSPVESRNLRPVHPKPVARCSELRVCGALPAWRRSAGFQLGRVKRDATARRHAFERRRSRHPLEDRLVGLHRGRCWPPTPAGLEAMRPGRGCRDFSSAARRKSPRGRWLSRGAGLPARLECFSPCGWRRSVRTACRRAGRAGIVALGPADGHRERGSAGCCCACPGRRSERAARGLLSRPQLLVCASGCASIARRYGATRSPYSAFRAAGRSFQAVTSRGIALHRRGRGEVLDREVAHRIVKRNFLARLDRSCARRSQRPGDR